MNSKDVRSTLVVDIFIFLFVFIVFNTCNGRLDFSNLIATAIACGGLVHFRKFFPPGLTFEWSFECKLPREKQANSKGEGPGEEARNRLAIGTTTFSKPTIFNHVWQGRVWCQLQTHHSTPCANIGGNTIDPFAGGNNFTRLNWNFNVPL